MIEPFLRSPPFAQVSASIAAVSQPADGATQPIDDAVIDMIAQAQVGGCFWGERRTGFRIIVGAGASVEPGALAGYAPHEIGIVEGGGCRGVAATPLPANCDPWALMARCERLHARPDDELALAAGLCGVEVMGPDGVIVGAATLRDQLRERLARARYRDCFSGETVDAARAVTILADWRRHIGHSRGIAAASGMAFWKRKAVRQFLWDGRASPPFLSPRRGLARAKRAGGTLAIWPSRVPPDFPEEAVRAEVPVARVEDGFIRSRGLGAALHPPGSVVIECHMLRPCSWRSAVIAPPPGASGLPRPLPPSPSTVTPCP